MTALINPATRDVQVTITLPRSQVDWFKQMGAVRGSRGEMMSVSELIEACVNYAQPWIESLPKSVSRSELMAEALASVMESVSQDTWAPIALPPPDHGLGYTSPFVDVILGSRAGAFWSWMSGQTMAFDEASNETIVYPDDLRRWAAGDRHVND